MGLFQIGNKLPVLTEAEVGMIENSIQKKLPQAYRDFLMAAKEGISLSDSYDVFSPDGRVLYTFVIKDFFGAHTQSDNNIIKVREKYLSALPPELLPIAYDRFHNFTCVNLENGHVYFVTLSPKDATNKNPIVIQHYVSNSFDEFVDKLYVKRFN
jgi:hypothetical protein